MTLLTLANAYGPRTGGVRTQIDALRSEYAAAGWRSALVHPWPRDEDDADAAGPIYRRRAPRLPINPDYRNLWALRPLLALAERVGPDSVEVVDKWTLPRLAHPLRASGLPVVGFSCERLDKVLATYLPAPLLGAPLAAYNRWFCRQFDAVVCHSEFAADELRAVGGRPLVVPLGVSATTFAQAAPDATLRAALLGDGHHLLLYVGRLVPEKRIGLLGDLMRLGQPRGLRLAVAGDGPERARLEGLPGVRMLGFERDKRKLAQLYASCDLFVQPSGLEAFGLGVLEALAAGCRVLCAAGGAAAEVLPRGLATVASDSPRAWLDAAVAALSEDRERAAAAARARAAEFPWSTTAARLMALHSGLAAGGRYNGLARGGGQ